MRTPNPVRLTPQGVLANGQYQDKTRQSTHTGLHESQFRTLHMNCLYYFVLSENVRNYKIGTTLFYGNYWYCLITNCVYFLDLNGMFTSSPTWRLKMHVLCKVGKNIIFQNKTLLVMFYSRVGILTHLRVIDHLFYLWTHKFQLKLTITRPLWRGIVFTIEKKYPMENHWQWSIFVHQIIKI